MHWWVWVDECDPADDDDGKDGDDNDDNSDEYNDDVNDNSEYDYSNVDLLAVQKDLHHMEIIKLKDDDINDGDDDDGDNDNDDGDGDVDNDDDDDLDLPVIQKDLHHKESSRPRILGLSIRRCFSNWGWGA